MEKQVGIAETDDYVMHFSYTSLNGYFAGSFITIYLPVQIIIPARKKYFKR
jgi:hypothetical protein